MVMIRCPECGQRALDVASVCPKCGHVLIQNPLETHDWGTLRECGRCGKHIERDAVICPYCGHHVRAARLAWRTTFSVAGVALAVALGIAAWRTGLMGSIRQAFRSPRPAAVEPRATGPGPAIALPVADSAAEPTSDTAPAAPVAAAAPDTATPPATVALRQPRREPAPASRPRDLVSRWTIEWANVRAARSVESTVVQVLPPGRAVEVREMRQGWWTLYAGGSVVGYIANSVLSATPPG